ncbi:MAG TPA: TRAP transporter large permease subunit [Anaeromyxobacteraceae bacterium]|nr:TRAP transporter large permease subunit [Anaeromyxobacteraceae bacterium]
MKLKIRKEMLFGLTLMAVIVAVTIWMLPAPSKMTSGHLGLLMLSLVVVAIMLGFPTAFTLMGMGVLFTWLAYRAQSPEIAVRQTLDLMVQRAYWVMTNDVLIAVPLFVFMGYLVERANLIAKLFKSLHLAIGRIPGSLAVATLVTCAVFATATGIIGAVVTLMGLLALPAMLRSGYDVKLSAGAITAGGTLGILIPPSVLLILYGATASVSVVQLYAGAFFPGIMLAGLYVLYVMARAWLNPKLAPRPPPEETRVDLPEWATRLRAQGARRALPGLLRAARRPSLAGVPGRTVWKQLFVATIPFLMATVPLALAHKAVTTVEVVETAGLEEMGADSGEAAGEEALAGGVEEPPPEEGEAAGGLAEPTPEEGRAAAKAPPAAKPPAAEEAAAGSHTERRPAPTWFWIVAALAGLALVGVYATFTFERLEIFKMLLGSFFPLSALILAVLGTIIFGWATPTEAAAMGATGGLILAAAYRALTFDVIKESVFLTAKTTAMVCWLFVGSSIFAAAFALLGGQQLVEHWVLSLDMTPFQFLLLAQFIIFILGWPLEWTEIIVIFMPIFLPLLGHFESHPGLADIGVTGDQLPLFFGLLVALNLQTAFLSPPVAMAAFYLKGVSPPHVTLNQIFAGMMPFMVIQVIALVILYLFPQIGLWLPSVVYQ